MKRSEWRARAILTAVCVGLAAAVVAYRLLVWGHLEQTAALFIGLPTVLALGLIICLPEPKSATGMMMAQMTVALLMGGILFQEGFICLLMMAPLFYLVGLAIAIPIDVAKNKKKAHGFPVLPPEQGRDKTLAISLLLMMAMATEGTTSWLSLPQEEQVTATELVRATPEQVEAQLEKTPAFRTTLPAYLQLGFPRPVTTSGSGLHAGDERRIHFAAGEGRPGDLVLQVAEHTPGRVAFRFVEDSSHIAHWLAWERSEVRFEAVAPGVTRVTWTLGYRRLLHPAWYFKPWERYGVGLAGHYLIQNLATPTEPGT